MVAPGINYLVFNGLELLIGQHNELVAHPQEAADRENDEGRLSILSDDDVVDLADRVIGFIDD